MGITDIAKEAGVRWKALSEEEKEPFVAQAMQDKARYTEEVRIIILCMLILPIFESKVTLCRWRATRRSIPTTKL